MNLLVLTHFPPPNFYNKNFSWRKLLVQQVEGDKPLSHRQWDEKTIESEGWRCRQKGWCDEYLGILRNICASVNLSLPLEHFYFLYPDYFPHNCGRNTENFRSKLRGNEQWFSFSVCFVASPRNLYNFHFSRPLLNISSHFVCPNWGSMTSEKRRSSRRMEGVMRDSPPFPLASVNDCMWISMLLCHKMLAGSLLSTPMRKHSKRENI